MSEKEYYRIIEAGWPQQLEERVNSIMGAGFVPVGGILYNAEVAKYFQATLYTPPQQKIGDRYGNC